MAYHAGVVRAVALRDRLALSAPSANTGRASGSNPNAWFPLLTAAMIRTGSAGRTRGLGSMFVSLIERLRSISLNQIKTPGAHAREPRGISCKESSQETHTFYLIK